MKATHITSIICSLILGISIIIGCVRIAEANDYKSLQEVSQESPVDSPLLNVEQAAAYLNVTAEQLNYIIQSEQRTLDTTHTFSGVMFPYFKLNNEIYISKSELTNWIKDITTQRRKYTEGLVFQ
jgi:hypothetical protein